MTITEALAELKTLAKRMEKKREAIVPYLLRQAVVLDPLLDSGGSKEFIRRERQALADMADRIVRIRTAIQRENHTTVITIEGEDRTIAEWLTWRRELAPAQQAFLAKMRQTIERVRSDFQKKGGVVAETVATLDQNVLVNVDELMLLHEIERVENVLGQLDGQLSQKNATVQIEMTGL